MNFVWGCETAAATFFKSSHVENTRINVVKMSHAYARSPTLIGLHVEKIRVYDFRSSVEIHQIIRLACIEIIKFIWMKGLVAFLL